MVAKVRLGVGKVCSAADAVLAIKPGDCITVSGNIGSLYPKKVIEALEVRFLTTGEPGGLTIFDPFPTGLPGIEPFSHPGFLKRIVAGWLTPFPSICDMINRNEIEAYLFPLGSLSFLCQQMAAGRRGMLTQVGLDTYIDPRHAGGRLNTKSCDSLISVEHVNGEEFLWYHAFPINAALIRGTLIDEAGNVSLEDDGITMNILNQALAAKASGGIVIAQAKKLVKAGSIHPRLVAVPGALVDHIVIDPDQHTDEANPDLGWLKSSDRLERPPDEVLAASNKEAWRVWVTERRIIDPPAPEPVPAASNGARPSNPTMTGKAPVLKERPITADVAIARRSALEVGFSDFVNIGAGVPSRDLLPVCIEEGIDRDSELSMEGGVLGGINNGVGFRSDVTSVVDTPTIFSLYHAGIPSQTFLGMLQFDERGNVNLLRYGDVWVGPGGSMDIAHRIERIVFMGTLTAGGLKVEATDGSLRIVSEGKIPRAVKQVEAVCFNGDRMLAAGKKVSFVTERAVFELTPDGIELVEVAPGIDIERDVIAHMAFRPRIAANVREMDPRIFKPSRMGLREPRSVGVSG